MKKKNVKANKVAKGTRPWGFTACLLTARSQKLTEHSVGHREGVNQYFYVATSMNELSAGPYDAFS